MTKTFAPPVTPAIRSSRTGARVRTELERISLVLAWIALVVVFGILRPDTFLTIGNFGTIFGSDAVLVVLTLGLLLPLRAGDYDLSVAGTLTLSAMTVGILNGGDHHSIWWVVVAALAM